MQMLPGMNPQFAPPFPGVPPPASQPDPYAAQLAPFWQQQVEEVQRIPSNDPTEFRNHQLPLARIKKVRQQRNQGARTCSPEGCPRAMPLSGTSPDDPCPLTDKALPLLPAVLVPLVLACGLRG